MIVIVMGVSGSGKTFIGSHLAKRAGWLFADADDYHSRANKEKMAAGHPLTDEDRVPWLRELHALLTTWSMEKHSGVLACSALKQSYRDALKINHKGDQRFVWLDGSPELIADRLAHRRHAYMNPALLPSQLAALEPPADALRIVNDRSPEEVVREILNGLGIQT